MDWFEQHILWVKALHVIAIVAWMAGLFYLPRLFVYHTKVDLNSESDTLFQVMEVKLYRLIMNPSMIFSLATGIILAILQQVWSFGWMHLKLLSVLGLLVFHHMLNHWRLSFARGERRHSEKFYRIINEVPTLLLVIVVFSVILKPF